MTYDALKDEVCQANLDVHAAGLVVLTWGNASAVDRSAGVMAIKPSGVAYKTMRPADMVVVSLVTGAVVDGTLRPSSDAPTHLHLYREFASVGGIVHTHSTHAVSWAQSEREIPCFGTTHADHFSGAIPVTRRLRETEVREHYEHDTGVVISETFAKRRLDPLTTPGVLVALHGPFAWGQTVEKAVDNAIALEAIAEMAMNTLRIDPDAVTIDKFLLDRHHQRKHGDKAYYGQR